MSVVGRVGEIWCYPVKSMYGERISSVLLESGGIASDRYWALWDMTDDRLVSGKRVPKILMLRARYVEEPAMAFSENRIPEVEITFPDDSTIRSSDSDAAGRLSAFLERKVKLIAQTPAENQNEPSSSFHDLGQLHILTTASLEHIRSFYPEGDFRSERYRPNITIETAPGITGFAEKDWQGGSLRIGDVVIDCIALTMRCSMPGASQPDIAADPNIPQIVRQHAERNLGIYASARASGMINAGDEVEFLPTEA